MARRRPRSSRCRRRSAQRGAHRVDPLRSSSSPSAAPRVAGNHVARGAVDLAVWDLVGQILGCPCHTLLGGFADDVAAAHMLSFGEPAAMADEAIAINDQLGVQTFKVKVGRAPAARCRSGRARSATALSRTPICMSTRTAAGATTTPSARAISSPSSGCGRSRSRSRSRTGPAGCASPTAGSCRWSAMRAASASRTSTARSRRARSGW